MGFAMPILCQAFAEKQLKVQRLEQTTLKGYEVRT